MPVVLAVGALAMNVSTAAAATIMPINLTANWTANTDWGSAAPGWYIDNSNVVHLKGAARQIFQSGNPEPGGDAAVRAGAGHLHDRHTFGGTYADLDIGSDGEIRLIGPKPPAQADYSFVSLDGVTFSYLNFDLVTKAPGIPWPIALAYTTRAGIACTAARSRGGLVPVGHLRRPAATGPGQRCRARR
jgi:hypothetical protein